MKQQGLQQGLTGQNINLNIHLIEAQNLPVITGTMKNSEPDPYVKILLNNQRQKTSVIKNTRNPRWDHKFFFEGVPRNCPIVFEVRDRNLLKKDRIIGRFTTDVNGLLNNPKGWFTLAGREGFQGTCGSIYLECECPTVGVSTQQFVQQGSTLPMGTQQQRTTVTQGQGMTGQQQGSFVPQGQGMTGQQQGFMGTSTSQNINLNIHLIEAQNLPLTTGMMKNSEPDPYVKILLNNQRQKSNIIKNCRNPRWDFRFHFEGVPRNCPIVFELRDKNLLKKDRIIGRLQTDVNKLINNPKGWFTLVGKEGFEGNCGSIYLECEFPQTQMGSTLSQGSFVPQGQGLTGQQQGYQQGLSSGVQQGSSFPQSQTNYPQGTERQQQQLHHN